MSFLRLNPYPVLLTSAAISAPVRRENVADLPSSQPRFPSAPPIPTTANRQAAVGDERFIAESVAPEPAASLPGTGGATCQSAMACQLPDVRLPSRSVLDPEPVVWGGVVRLRSVSHASRSALRSHHGDATIHQGALEDGLML